MLDGSSALWDATGEEASSVTQYLQKIGATSLWEQLTTEHGTVDLSDSPTMVDYGQSLLLEVGGREGEGPPLVLARIDVIDKPWDCPGCGASVSGKEYSCAGYDSSTLFSRPLSLPSFPFASLLLPSFSHSLSCPLLSPPVA